MNTLQVRLLKIYFSVQMFFSRYHLGLKYHNPVTELALQVLGSVNYLAPVDHF